MDIEIKEATPLDVETLFTLWTEMQDSHDAYDEDYYKLNAGLKDDDVKNFLEAEIKNAYALMFVAILNGKIIGFIHAKPSTRPPIYHYKNVIQVSMVGVAKGHRGKGVATSLFKALENEVKEEGVYLSLSVDVDNRAVGLYERLGFKKRHLMMYKKFT